jgi:hypothetical protein
MKEPMRDLLQSSDDIPITRVGRAMQLQLPIWLVDYETNVVVKYEIKLTDTEEKYYDA